MKGAYCCSTRDEDDDAALAVGPGFWLYLHEVLEDEAGEIERPGEVHRQSELPDVEAVRLVVGVDDLRGGADARAVDDAAQGRVGTRCPLDTGRDCCCDLCENGYVGFYDFDIRRCKNVVWRWGAVDDGYVGLLREQVRYCCESEAGRP